MSRKLILITCLFLLIIYNNYANDINTIHSQYKVNYLTVDEGLSNNKVNAICQDKYGFIWLGTNEGLNRYDGFTFKVYKNNPDNSTTLSNNFIRALLKDSKGKLWIGTYDGLCYYNEEYDNFTQIPFEGNKFDNEDYVWHLCEDSFGTLWISTTNGLYQVIEGEKVAKRFCKIKELVSLAHVTEVYYDSRKNLLVGARPFGLCIYNLNTEKYKIFSNDKSNVNSLSENWIESIYEDNNGYIWIGTNNEGLNLFSYKDSSFTRIEIAENDYQSKRVRDIWQDSTGRIWLGTRNGIYVKNTNSNKFIHYAHSKHEYSILKNNSIYDLYIDNNDILWIGTYAGGVNYIDFNEKKFLHFYAKTGDNRFLNDNVVYTIFEDRDRDLWIGTERGGVSYYDWSEGTFAYFLHDPKNTNSISSNNIKAIIQDRFENMWIGTYEGGLDYYNTKTKTFKHYVHDPNDQSSIAKNSVYALLIDREKNLWIGMGSAIDILPEGSNDFIHLTRKESENLKFNGDLVLTIFQDSRDDIWVTTYNSGMYLFNKEDSTFNSEYKKLNSGIIHNMCEDSKGQLWIAGASGLYCIIREKDSIIHYTEKDGLPINTIFRVLDDKEGNIWVSTSLGLSKFKNGINNPINPVFRNYDVTDGLQSKSFMQNSYNRPASGAMYFGGVNGFNAFYPEEIKDNLTKPKVVITNLKIFNKNVTVGEKIKGKIVLNNSISETEKLILSYKHYVFTIEFAGLHYSQPSKNQFKYILEGFEEDWNLTGAEKQFATYTNLSGGEYTFIVKASNCDGIWENEPASIKIIVLPPFWKTWWFRFIVVVFLNC